jgi:hypothetical protein
LMAAKMSYDNQKAIVAMQQEQVPQWWATNKSISNMLVNDMIQGQSQSTVPSLETIQ